MKEGKTEETESVTVWERSAGRRWGKWISQNHWHVYRMFAFKEMILIKSVTTALEKNALLLLRRFNDLLKHYKSLQQNYSSSISKQVTALTHVKYWATDGSQIVHLELFES